MNIRKASVEASTDANARSEGDADDARRGVCCNSFLYSRVFNCPSPSSLDSPSYAPRSCSCINSMFSKDCSRIKSETKASTDLSLCARTILYEQRVTTFSIVVRVGDSFVVALYLRQKSNYSSCALAVRGVWCA